MINTFKTSLLLFTLALISAQAYSQTAVRGESKNSYQREQTLLRQDLETYWTFFLNENIDPKHPYSKLLHVSKNIFEIVHSNRNQPEFHEALKILLKVSMESVWAASVLCENSHHQRISKSPNTYNYDFFLELKESFETLDLGRQGQKLWKAAKNQLNNRASLADPLDMEASCNPNWSFAEFLLQFFGNTYQNENYFTY